MNLRDLIAKGKVQGYLLYTEILETLPDKIQGDKYISEILAMISEMDIRVYRSIEEAQTPEPELSAVQQRLLEKLSKEQLEFVDEMLIAEVKRDWTSLGVLVSRVRSAVSKRIIGIPEPFYAQRVRELVKEGKLTASGNLRNLRDSKVRLPD